MIDKQVLGFVSIGVSLVGYGSYVKTVLARLTEPHLLTWLVWSVMMAIVFFAQTSKGGEAGAWVTGVSAAACVVIAILSLCFGDKNIKRSDWLAFVAALMIIPVWYFTDDALSAVVMATLIDALAYYPTFRKSWHRPHQESYFMYLMDVVKWVPALLALGSYSLTTMLYPLFLVIADASLVVLILLRRRVLRLAVPKDQTA